MTVNEMLSRMTAHELAEWQVFYGIDPWGEQRADLRNASLIASVANMFRGKKGRQVKPADFMLFPDEKRETVPSDPKRRFQFFKWFFSKGKQRSQR